MIETSLFCSNHKTLEIDHCANVQSWMILKGKTDKSRCLGLFHQVIIRFLQYTSIAHCSPNTANSLFSKVLMSLFLQYCQKVALYSMYMNQPKAAILIKGGVVFMYI